jgi:hypothetical protein
MTYRQALIEAASMYEPPKPLDYMEVRNRQWYSEWLIRRARYQAQLAAKEKRDDERRK